MGTKEIRGDQRTFYEYRIRVELNCQTSLFEVDRDLSEREQKNKAVRRAFDFIDDRNTYIEFRSGSQDISVIKFQTICEDILIMKLARKKPVELPKKGLSTFVEKTEDIYPYAYIIFDCRNQILYVERVLQVYQLPNAMIKIMQDLFCYINNQISENTGKNFYINIISREEDFMECFNSFDIVNKISLKLNSPNCFLGSHEADELLSQLREETQTKTTTLEFASDDGLNGEGFYNQFKHLINYAARGGGGYSIRGTNVGSSKQITKNSNNKIKTLNLTLNFNIGQDQVNNSEQLADRIRNENDYEDKE